MMVFLVDDLMLLPFASLRIVCNQCFGQFQTKVQARGFTLPRVIHNNMHFVRVDFFVPCLRFLYGREIGEFQSYKNYKSVVMVGQYTLTGGGPFFPSDSHNVNTWVSWAGHTPVYVFWMRSIRLCCPLNTVKRVHLTNYLFFYAHSKTFPIQW